VIRIISAFIDILAANKGTAETILDTYQSKQARSSIHPVKGSCEPGAGLDVPDPNARNTLREIMNANWSSWMSPFDPLRINSLQRPSRNLLIALEGVGHAWSVLSRQNRPQIPKNQALTAKRRVWRVF
jgi:hypothetical protein